jgi:Putative restriction endonuclease
MQQTQTAIAETTNGTIPSLVHGDRLTRAEFERRYHATPPHVKAELIEGVVYMPSPVRYENHCGPHLDIAAWLGMYRAFTPGIGGANEGTVRLGDSSEPQPDVALFILPKHGGRVRISKDDYLENGPELVAEVAASSIPYDTGLKLQMYQRYDVQEYIIWRVPDQEIDWFIRRDGQYVQLTLDGDDRLCSEVFPGLWLDTDALIRGDMAQVLSVLQQGLATADHAAFVSRLNPPISKHEAFTCVKGAVAVASNNATSPVPTPNRPREFLPPRDRETTPPA